MQLFKEILFPVDLSHISPKIAPYVRELAKMFEAKVHLLFVARVFEHLTSAHLPNLTIDNLETEIAREAEKKLHEFMDTYFKYDSCKAKVVSGNPAEEILIYAELEKIDLIIMGTHGRKRIEPILFGSVADRIVKNSPVPVLTIDPYGRSEGREPHSFEDL